MCDTRSGQVETDEAITLTFTYNALYKGADGKWVLPGSIFYKGVPVAGASVDQATGKVTVKVTLDGDDTVSVIRRGDLSNTPAGQIDGSNLRFVPSRDTFNENDVLLDYTVSVQDTKSGAVADLGSKAGTVLIDAVADKPIITGEAWNYDTAGATAFSSENVSLSFTVRFPDTGTNGLASETQYILIQQTTGMSLDQNFVDAVNAAGHRIDLYPDQNELYYRIPARFFPESPAGSHTYSVTIGLVADKVTSDEEQYPAPIIQALAIVTSTHGGERNVGNNTAQTLADLPDLDFAVVDTVVVGGRAEAYEGNTPDAYLGNYTPGTGALFNLGLVLGNSPTGPGNKEVVTSITFTYPPGRGMLSYSDDGGTTWRDVPSGGQVPQQYSHNLRFIPYDTGQSNADLDVKLGYSVMVTEPATGQQKTITGDYLIVIDAVAEQPINATAGNVVYGDGDDKLGFGETVSIDVSVTFPDFAKSVDGHADHYILIQKPSADWALISTGLNPEPVISNWTNDNTNYWRIPVTPGGPSGTAALTVVLQAPQSGWLLYENSDPIRVGGMTVDRDPGGRGPAPGDLGITNNNNYAYTEDAKVRIVYDDEGYRYLTVDPLFENNIPKGNELKPDGTPNTDKGGGKVTLPDTITVSDGGTGTVDKDVDYVILNWDSSKGVLVVGNTPYNSGPQTILKADFDKVHFETNNPNSDADLGTVTATVHTSDGADYPNTFNAVTDAVAQPPQDIDAVTDYGGKTAVVPGKDVSIDVTAVFPDTDGSEQHYIFVQQPGTDWGNPNHYDIYNAPDGNTYYMVPVAPGVNTATVVLTVPTSFSGTDLGDGRQSMDLIVGGMSREDLTTNPSTGPHGVEVRDDNNTAFNLTGKATIVTSTAESTPVINVTNTYAGSDKNGDGTPVPGDEAKVYITGLNAASDEISQVVLTYPDGHGALYYNGVEITNSTPGVAISSAGGSATMTIDNADIISALTSGNAASSAVTYVSEDGNAEDVPLHCVATVDDKFSADTKTHESNASVIVDAVARQPEDVSMDINGAQDDNVAVVPGSPVLFEVTATFPDFDDPSVDANHYLAVQQLDGWDVYGDMPAGVVVESYNGVTYYLISADLYGGGQSPALVRNPDGSFTFSLELKAPDSVRDIPDAGTIQGGALTIANIPDLPDRELTLDNNRAIVADTKALSIGVVETTKADFVFSPVLEDDEAGSPISLSSSGQAALTANNEKITQTDLTFSGDFSSTPTGGVVGTVIYDGKAYEATKTADGKAMVTVDFTATGGYDPTAEFRMVWGTVEHDGSGAVNYVGGNPVFITQNHTGSSMSVTSSSTVVDIASNDTGAATGSATADFSAKADTPGVVSVPSSPVMVTSGNEVSFVLRGDFTDIDGSEQHYLLVQQLPGWTGDYQTMAIGGGTYFMVPATNTLASPSVTVFLNKPDGLTDTGDANVQLRVGAVAYDGSTGAAQVNHAVEIIVGEVTATGVTMTAGPTAEDTAAPLAFTLAGDGPMDNDAITAITITDLKGGTLLLNSVPVAGPVPLSLTVADALSGKYSYLPPAHGSGDYTLGFTAVVTDSKTNASVSFAGQTGTVTVNPVATAPHTVSGSSDGGVDQLGHVKAVTVTLKAAFDDTDGSEEHFFLVALPAGVTAPAGLTEVADTALQQAAVAAGLPNGQTLYRVNADAAGEAVFTATQAQNSGGDPIVYAAVSVEKALLGETDPGYALVKGTDISVTPAGVINEDPTGRTIVQDVTTASGSQVSGAIGLHDPDGDPVTITAVTVNGDLVNESGGIWEYVGNFGYLQLYADGSYTYTRNSNAAGQDDIVISLADNAMGTATTNLSFVLTEFTSFAGFRSLVADEGDLVIPSDPLSDTDESKPSGGVPEDQGETSLPGDGLVGTQALAYLMPEAGESSPMDGGEVPGVAWLGLALESGSLDALFAGTPEHAEPSGMENTDSSWVALDTALPQAPDIWQPHDGTLAEAQHMERLRLECGG